MLAEPSLMMVLDVARSLAGKATLLRLRHRI
jgi:hypothetical protein